MSNYGFVNSYISPGAFKDPCMVDLAIKHNKYRNEYNNKPKEIIYSYCDQAIPVGCSGSYMNHCYFNSGNSVRNVIG